MTNAGIGSNLTLDGKIECDASIMDEQSFGAVGAVSGISNICQEIMFLNKKYVKDIQNPITVAWALLHGQQQGLMEGGRIPPW